MSFAGAKALVLGMEKSGHATAEFLRGHGAAVTPADLKPQDLPGFRLQTDDLFDEPWDLIVPSPGVPLDLERLQRARSRGIPVIGEVELAAPFLKGPIIGITGSNGKTTTTSLVGHILDAAYVPNQVGGNIGKPVLSLTATSRDNQWNVLELSSFQLETVSTFHARVAVCLNVTQNHLDRHYTMEQYAAAKANLFRTQSKGDFAILNSDNEWCRSFAGLTPAAKNWFSAGDIRDGQIWVDGEELMPMADVPVPGAHNAENVMAAASVALIAGVARDLIVDAVRTFKAVEHRLEFVMEKSGVRFFNDSKATSVDAAIKALDSFGHGLWVILGGKDKGSDYTVLRDRLHARAKAALLIGAAAEKIASHLKGAVPLIQAGTLENAVTTAYAQAEPGDTILLAPACASYDQFQSFEHRGREFKEIVRRLQPNS
jgi:UDP-N-acetylmuramoylalanine--D-glutamate ligase